MFTNNKTEAYSLEKYPERKGGEKSPQKSGRARNIALSAVSITLGAGIFVSILCDMILNKEITWSLYPAASCAFAWFFLFPLIKLKKGGAFGSMAILTILTVPFLFVLEYAAGAKDWVRPLGAPIALISLVYMWITGIIILKTKMRVLYKVSIAVFLSAPLSFFTNKLAAEFAGETVGFSDIMSVISIVFAAFVLFFIGYSAKKKD
jgi:hypothetical protein